MAYEIKYRSEDEMKDSGVEWIGVIPNDWIVCKIKNISSLKTGNSISATDKDNKYSKVISEYYSYIGTKDVNLDTNTIEYDNGLYIPKATEFKTAKKHTSLICIEGGSAGRKLGYLDRKVCFGNKLCNVEGNNKIINKLLYYIIQSEYFSVEFFNKTTGIIPGVSIEEFKNIVSVLPISKEQNKIANFLDLKTAEFDSIISKKEDLIEKLQEAKKSLISEVVTGKVKIVDGELVERKADEMKNSESIYGFIAKDWEVTRFKFIATIKARIGWRGLKADEYVDRGYFFLATPNIKGRDIDFENVNYITKERYMESPEIKLKKGDVLLTKDGSTLGTVNIVRKLDEEGTINSSIALIRMSNNFDPILMYYFLLSSEMQDKINLMKDGMGVPHLFQRDIKEFEIILPTYKESKKNIEFLDYKTLEIEEIINKTKLQIQKLKQAKQSLISEAVTGKIDLRDWVIEEI